MTDKETVKDKKKIYSVRTSIIGTVFLASFLTALMILITVIPIMQRNMTETTKTTLKSMAEAYGQASEISWAAYQEGCYTSGILDAMFANAKIDGVPSSYVYLVDKNSIMRYHPTASKIGAPVENSVVKGLIADMSKGKRPEVNAVEYEYKGAIKLAGYYVHSGLEYIIVITADEDDVLSEVDAAVRNSALNSIVCTLFCLALGIFVAIRIVRPLHSITFIITKLQNLDFSREEIQDKLDKRKDETGDMSRAITKLTEHLKDVLENLQIQSNTLLEAAAALENNTKETIRSVSQVEQAVGDIATGATSQADETQNATENVVMMGQMISATSDEVAVLNSKSQDILASSDQATRILGELSEINRRAVEAVDIIHEQTNTTNVSAQKIREATNLISSIAEETNLLSLNASIEAARAGEQGRGFAVVAAQIQKLAEQSNQSASQIEQIIASLLGDTAKAVETMDSVKEIMARQNDKVNNASETFKMVKSELDASIAGIGNIAKATEELQSARSNVVDVVQNLTAIAQENAASTEETSASVTEIASIIEDIAGNATALKDVAESIEKNMKQFKI